MSEENIEEIKAFYQDCNNLLKDITIEWIKDDGSIGETIKGDDVLEYIDTFNKFYHCEQYQSYRDKEYGFYHRYKNVKILNKFSNTNKLCIGFVSKHKKEIICHHYDNIILYRDTSNSNIIHPQNLEYLDPLYNNYVQSYNNLLTLTCMLLNSIDYKFYKFNNSEVFLNSLTYYDKISCINNDIYNIFNDSQPFYKTLQVKYKNEIIYKMTLNNHRIKYKENDIFNCVYKINDKNINFNLIDIYNDSINLYNYVDYGTYRHLYQKSINLLNHPYGQRVFYNVIYLLENKLINQVSETSKNQELINCQNYNNQLLQKNQEIEELKRLLQEKFNFNEIQDNLIKSLTETLNTFKEKYENQLKIHQEEFEKLKLEHNEKYNILLKEFNNNSEEIKKLIDENNKLKQENEKSINKLKEENETNKQKLDEILSENLQLKEENETFNKEILEIIQIYNENFNHINKISKTDLIQLKETLTRILDNNINLNNKLKQKEEKINKLQERINKLHNQNDKLNDEIERLKSETQKMNSYKKQLIDISKDILNLQTDI